MANNRDRASSSQPPPVSMDELVHTMQRLLDPIHTRLDSLEQRSSTDAENPFHNQPQQSNHSETDYPPRQEQNRRDIPQPRQPRRDLPQPCRGRWINNYDEDEDGQFNNEYGDFDSADRRHGQQIIPPRQQRPHEDDNISGIKLRIPSFNGKYDPDSYFDWERIIELIFRLPQLF